MTTIKKQYTAINAALVALTNKKLTPKVLAELQALMASKGGEKTFITNDEGTVIAIRCYYFKRWMSPEFFASKKTASGYNSMCKLGTNTWSKQQRVAKKANAELLEKLMDGALTSDEAKILSLIHI